MMQHFLCTNCGFWQKHFETPSSCPVCMDFRHTPPNEGWEFLDANTVRERVSTQFLVDDDEGVITFWNEPSIGIGTRGYLILQDQGAVFWDGCAWYDDAALETVARWSEQFGGLRLISASHPHAYGALWQLQGQFEVSVALPVADLGWTNAFSVSHPFEDVLNVAAGLRIVQTGGHFDGHAVLYWDDSETLLAGDLLKFHYEGTRLSGLSTHKAFNRQIPMSHAEIRRYRESLEGMNFSRVWTSFDCESCTRDDAFRLFDAQLQGAPFPTPVPLSDPMENGGVV